MSLLMTATLTTPAARFDNAAFDCGPAQIRAHFRHLATVVTITGRIDAANVDPVTEYTRRFILAKDALILDLSDVNLSAAEAISFVNTVAAECRAAGVECMLVAGEAVVDVLDDFDDEALLPIAGSVHEALHYFADVIATRRQLLLPLIKKTA
jgi:anti-anti-sigma regulatory factor